MGIFRTQTLFDLTLDTNIDLSSATLHDIIYEKPDETTGSWTGTVVDTNKIRYQVQSGDLDQIGHWRFQSKATVGGRTGYGDIKLIEIAEPL